MPRRPRRTRSVRKKRVSRVLRVRKTNRVVLGEGYLISRVEGGVKLHTLLDSNMGIVVGHTVPIHFQDILDHQVVFPENITGKEGDPPKKIRLIAEVLE